MCFFTQKPVKRIGKSAACETPVALRASYVSHFMCKNLFRSLFREIREGGQLWIRNVRKG